MRMFLFGFLGFYLMLVGIAAGMASAYWATGVAIDRDGLPLFTLGAMAAAVVCVAGMILLGQMAVAKP